MPTTKLIEKWAKVRIAGRRSFAISIGIAPAGTNPSARLLGPGG
ncbi:hypothetical protein [Bradyrhizobium sp. B117]